MVWGPAGAAGECLLPLLPVLGHLLYGVPRVIIHEDSPVAGRNGSQQTAAPAATDAVASATAAAVYVAFAYHLSHAGSVKCVCVWGGGVMWPRKGHKAPAGCSG
jgi:hypothetical protein